MFSMGCWLLLTKNTNTGGLKHCIIYKYKIPAPLVFFSQQFFKCVLCRKVYTEAVHTLYSRLCEQYCDNKTTEMCFEHLKKGFADIVLKFIVN